MNESDTESIKEALVKFGELDKNAVRKILRLSQVGDCARKMRVFVLENPDFAEFVLRKGSSYLILKSKPKIARSVDGFVGKSHCRYFDRTRYNKIRRMG
jgi:hypothetical protein